jgi:hypothetical protein
MAGGLRTKGQESRILGISSLAFIVSLLIQLGGEADASPRILVPSRAGPRVASRRRVDSRRRRSALKDLYCCNNAARLSEKDISEDANNGDEVAKYHGQF